MALHVWLVEGSKIILNIEQILKVPILATIYNDWHNDRELMYKIFKFIDCYADEDGLYSSQWFKKIKRLLIMLLKLLNLIQTLDQLKI